jgi:hypothetical protein
MSFPPSAKVAETGVAVAVEKCPITGSWKTVSRLAKVPRMEQSAVGRGVVTSTTIQIENGASSAMQTLVLSAANGS